MFIPFVKAHGARNDFLLTWASDVNSTELNRLAVAICDRNAGIGADGWLLVERSAPAIRLFNSDGSEAEISGNGTRCAAAFLLDAGAGGNEVVIRTGAGDKHLRLLSRAGKRFEFEMNMGLPEVREETTLEGYPAVVMWVGNPQCALLCDRIPQNWVEIGRRLESDARFPNRTNVSFVRAVDRQTVEARFYERGAGWTMSSGTGSTGAAFAAMHRGLATPPLTVLTEAGPLTIRQEKTLYLSGPAEIIARGEFFWNE